MFIYYTGKKTPSIVLIEKLGRGASLNDNTLKKMAG
jgi:hypothetical protein